MVAALVLLGLALKLHVVPTALPAAVGGEGGEGGGGPLLPCGTSGDIVQKQRQLIDVFEVVRGVCAQRGESVPPDVPLPASCVSAECQRVVQLAVDSCGPTFAHDGFLKSAFKPVLDAAVAVCAAAPHSADAQVRSREGLCLAPRCIATDSQRSRASQRHVITGHESASRALALQADDGGRLTDGMGTGGYNASIIGWRTTLWCRRQPSRWRRWTCARCG